MLRCRFEIDGSGDGLRVGTPSVAIVAGPEPRVPATITDIQQGTDVEVALDGIEPDPSWSRWRATVTTATAARFPPGGISICAFGAQLLCDTLVQHDPPPLDGHAHILTIPTYRLLLTSAGWIDCEKVVCAIAISRAVEVEVGPQNHLGPDRQTAVAALERGSLGPVAHANIETIAMLPYQLASTTPTMRQPTLTFEAAGPIHLGDSVTAVLHNPPPNVADSELLLWRCSGISPHNTNPCEGGEPPTWTKRQDGSLEQQEALNLHGANLKYGIYLALVVPTRPVAALDYIHQLGTGTPFVDYGTRVAQTKILTVTETSGSG